MILSMPFTPLLDLPSLLFNVTESINWPGRPLITFFGDFLEEFSYLFLLLKNRGEKQVAREGKVISSGPSLQEPELLFHLF
jgi:hypothetical protein